MKPLFHKPSPGATYNRGRCLTLARLTKFFLLLLISQLFSGCAQLPDYAQPHIRAEPFDPKLGYINYRELTMEDFKATVPARSIQGYQHLINAHTSVSLRPVHDSRYIVSPPHLNFGVYRVYLSDLGFKAVMIPERSCWNPSLHRSKKEYVLQHEQIHFALMEIAARQLNRRLAQSPERSLSSPNLQALQQLLENRIKFETDASKRRILEKHTTFDEQTSLYHDPERQQEWYDECQQRLLDLQHWAK